MSDSLIAISSNCCSVSSMRVELENIMMVLSQDRMKSSKFCGINGRT